MGQTLSERVYARVPIWAQNAMVTAKGLEFRHRRASDSQIAAQLSFLLESQHWTVEQFRDYRNARIAVLMEGAFNDVPFYRDLAKREGMAARDFLSEEDLHRIPLLVKTDLRGNEEAFYNESVPDNKRVIIYTSGTTGMPLRLVETQGSISRKVGFVARLRSWAGCNDPLHPRRAMFTGRTVVPATQSSSSRTFWRHNRADNALLFSAYHISPRTAPLYIEQLRHFQPELIDGYPSCMLTLAACAGGRITGLHKLKAIITTSETVTPDDRAVLEHAFGVRVHDQYATSEPSCFWGDCEYGVMHESPEYGVTEVLDAGGREVVAGAEGQIVVTSFLNPAMPLIRYCTGDMALRGPDAPCECGRHMRRMDRIVGRIEDTLYFPERGFMKRFDLPFKGVSGLLEAQVIQDALDHITVLVVAAPDMQKDGLHILERNFQEKLGPSIKVSFEIVDIIPRGANGKFKAVHSTVRHLYPKVGAG